MTDPRDARLSWVLAVFAVVTVVASACWYRNERHTVNCDDAYVAGNIVPVQALVAGVVVAVDVDDSMAVHVEQSLVSQEQTLLQEQLEQAAASLAEAVRVTRSHFAEVEEVRNGLAVTRALRSKLAADLARYSEAHAGGAASAQKVSDTEADLAVLDKKIAAAQARLHKVNALVEHRGVQDNPLVLERRAAYVTAFVQHARAHLLAPVDGIIANRRVQAGQQVNAGQVLMHIVPLHDLWVTANIKETEMGEVRVGQRVQIHADLAGRDVSYHGQVLGLQPAAGSSFSLFPPDNTTGNYIHIVERVPVRIALHEDELRDHPLRPGLSVTVSIDTEDAGPARDQPSQVQTAAASYRTAIFERELAAANAAADSLQTMN
jgi:membrane fusion protein (multidrug efflux system)